MTGKQLREINDKVKEASKRAEVVCFSDASEEEFEAAPLSFRKGHDAMPITNKLGLPQPFVDAATQSHTYTPNRYSVTQLLKGTRQAILERRHVDEIERDAAEQVWAIFGSAFHKILEQAQETETQLKENWVSADVLNGYTVSGVFDLYDDSTGTVTDYKTCSVWRVIYGDWDEYHKQLLMYAWILRQMGFDAKRGEIVALLKDHSKSKAKHEAGYPPYPVVRKVFDFTEDDIEGIGWYLKLKFQEIERAEQLPDDQLPLCTPTQRWYRPGKFAVMKNGCKRAIKLYDDRAQADIHALEIGGYVEERPGVDGKCPEYCSAAPFCTYWQEKYGKESKQ